jgi:hypothetical protein
MFNKKFKNLLISITIISTLVFPLICNAMDRPPKDLSTATIIDDETGKPIEGAVAIAIWRDYTGVSLVNALHGGGVRYKKSEEVVSDKEGKITINGFWKTTKGKGGTGNDYDPRLTVYKFGYVCWDQQEIFVPKYKWEKRTDFNKKSRIVRLKKWPEGFSFQEHSSFIGSATQGEDSLDRTPLFVKEEDKKWTYVFSFDEKYKTRRKYDDDYYLGIIVYNYVSEPVYHGGEFIPEEPLGVLVDFVRPESLLFQIIYSESIIRKMNNIQITNIDEFVKVVKNIKEGDTINITAYKNNKSMDFKINIKELYWKIENRNQTEAIKNYPENIKKWEEQGGRTNKNIPKPAPPAPPSYTK